MVFIWLFLCVMCWWGRRERMTFVCVIKWRTYHIQYNIFFIFAFALLWKFLLFPFLVDKNNKKTWNPLPLSVSCFQWPTFQMILLVHWRILTLCLLVCNNINKLLNANKATCAIPVFVHSSKLRPQKHTKCSFWVPKHKGGCLFSLCVFYKC